MTIEYLVPIIAYFLGSIPFGYILIRRLQGADIRTEGSGNIGATNVYRKSRWTGILTLFLDAGKGYLAVALAGWMTDSVTWETVAAVGAIAGHIFTVWLGFRGGKGVATGCGAYLAISPAAVGTTLVVFVAVGVLSGYISLGSIVATAAFPLWAYLYEEPLPVLLGAIVGSALIVAKHHENIRRLFSGGEGKFAPGSRS